MYESQTHGVAGHSSTKDEGSPSCETPAGQLFLLFLTLFLLFLTLSALGSLSLGGLRQPPDAHLICLDQNVDTCILELIHVFIDPAHQIIQFPVNSPDVYRQILELLVNLCNIITPGLS